MSWFRPVLVALGILGANPPQAVATEVPVAEVAVRHPINRQMREAVPEMYACIKAIERTQKNGQNIKTTANMCVAVGNKLVIINKTISHIPYGWKELRTKGVDVDFLMGDFWKALYAFKNATAGSSFSKVLVRLNGVPVLNESGFKATIALFERIYGEMP